MPVNSAWIPQFRSRSPHVGVAQLVLKTCGFDAAKAGFALTAALLEHEMRPNLLVTWTGKDINTSVSTLTDAESAKYVDRLRDIVTSGLWMTVPPERIEGFGPSFISYKAPMTCFTEVRLSITKEHSRRYGLLGIAVDRCFVLDRLGGPVHYVRNGPDECVVGNVNAIRDHVIKTASPAVENYLAVNAAFLKPMSTATTDDFSYIDENEWRIVHTHRGEEKGSIVKTGRSVPLYRIPLHPNDVQLVVFPDSKTRARAVADPTISRFFARQDRPFVFLLVEECLQF